MEAFKFRFLSVLKVRRVEMDKQAKNYGLAVQAVQRMRQKIQSIQAQLDAEVRRLRELSNRGQFADQLLDLSRTHRKGLLFDLRRSETQLIDLRNKAEHERLLLVEKQKRVKALEQLEEKEREAYEDEIRKRETKQLDELASVRHDFTLKQRQRAERSDNIA